MTLRQFAYCRLDIPTHSHPIGALPAIAKYYLTVFSLTKALSLLLSCGRQRVFSALPITLQGYLLNHSPK